MQAGAHRVVTLGLLYTITFHFFFIILLLNRLWWWNALALCWAVVLRLLNVLRFWFAPAGGGCGWLLLRHRRRLLHCPLAATIAGHGCCLLLAPACDFAPASVFVELRRWN